MNYNIKKLYKSKDYDKIVYILNSETSIEQIQELIILCKKEQVFIDLNGKNKYKKFIKIIDDKKKLLSAYKQELIILNDLVKIERNMQGYLNYHIKKKRRFAVLWEYLCDINEKNEDFIHKNADKLVKQNIDPQLKFNWSVDLASDLIKLIISDKIGGDKTILNYFPFVSIISQTARLHCEIFINYAINSSIVDNLIQLWKNNFIEVSYSSKEIIFRHTNKIALDWFLKSGAKLEIEKRILDKEISLVAMKYPKTFTSNFNDNEKIAASAILQEELHLENENVQIADVELKYWIKAYDSIINYCLKFLKDIEWQNNLEKRLYLSSYFYLTRDAWLTLFTDNGIPFEQSEKIFDKMIFNDKATDLYDYPFIKVKNRFLLAYFVLKNASAGLILSFRLKQENVHFSERGKFFEKYLFKLIKNCNVPIVNLHRKVSKQEYECDFAFVLDDTLFLCECKDNGDKAIQKFSTEFYNADITQANRIFDFFSNNLDYVIHAFKTEGYQNIKINHIKRLLIYNTSFHSALEKNGVIIIDKDRIITPFRRGNLDKRIVTEYSDLINSLKDNYTAEKLLNYIYSSVDTCNYTNKLMYMGNSRMKFGKYTLIFDDYKYGNMDDEQILNLLMPNRKLLKKSEIEAFFNEFEQK